jgi:subtilisin family serine protease
LNGTGIGIAILDSGIYTSHHSLRSSTYQSRVVANVDFTGEGTTADLDGHGTHVASLAAGNSDISYGSYTGIAPAANLINVRVLNSQGQGSTSGVIAGIDWCVSNKAQYNIRVMNISLGTTAVDSYLDDPLCLAVRRAFSAGIVVCVAAGNLGKDEAGQKLYGSIHSPGIEPSAITVGAANTHGSDNRISDSVATYSSRGPTRGYYTDTNGVRHYDNLIKPDLIAPGNKLIGAQSPNNRLATENPALDVAVSSNPGRKMMRMSGTSMSTPIVAGAAALLLQRNPALTPNLVKAILEYTAQPLSGYNNFEQGAGLLNIEGAVRFAAAVRQDLTGLAVGSPLLATYPPVTSTTIANKTFSWGRGIVQKWNVIYGSVLLTKFHGIYAHGVLLAEGVLLSEGTLIADGSLLADGVLATDGVILSDGTLLESGSLLADGVMLGDGSLISDGVLLGDGVVMSDSVLIGSAAAANAMSVPATGDEGSGVPEVVPDIEP